MTDHIHKTLNSKIKVSFIDGDDLHPKSNKDKMKKGIKLNDKDRKPWLIAIRSKIDQHESFIVDDSNKEDTKLHILLIACSALKYSYRQILRGHSQRQYKLNTNKQKLFANKLKFIFLDGKRSTLEKRLKERTHEYMDPNLLDSQLETLEYPNTKYVENDVVIEHIENSPSVIVNNITNNLIKTQKFTI